MVPNIWAKAQLYELIADLSIRIAFDRQKKPGQCLTSLLIPY